MILEQNSNEPVMRVGFRGLYDVSWANRLIGLHKAVYLVWPDPGQLGVCARMAPQHLENDRIDKTSVER